MGAAPLLRVTGVRVHVIPTQNEFIKLQYILRGDREYLEAAYVYSACLVSYNLKLIAASILCSHRCSGTHTCFYVYN